jgi:hypothetical protein
MNKRPDASVKVRCYNHECRKIFVVNLVKEEDIPGGKKVEMIRPCPYCGKDNVFEVEEGMAPPDDAYREIIKGRGVG